MIAILYWILPAVYIFFTVKTHITPICSSFVWFKKNCIDKLKKPKVEDTEMKEVDAFSKKLYAPKPITAKDKIINKSGDSIAQFLVEAGKGFVDIDGRIKIFGIILLNVCFFVGVYYSISAIIHHWKISFAVFALVIEWITWIKINKSDNNKFDIKLF